MTGRFRPGYSLSRWLEMMRGNANVFARVNVAYRFLREQFPTYSDERLLSELVCHDYSHPVIVASLNAGLELVGYKSPSQPALSGSYFAPVGTPLTRVGAGYEALASDAPVAKQFRRYRIKAAVPAALKSVCAPARDMWSRTDLPMGQLAGGGGVQYVIPNAANHLEVV